MNRSFLGKRLAGLGLLLAIVATGPVLAKKKRTPIYPITEVMTVAGSPRITVLPPKISFENYPGNSRTMASDALDVSRWIQSIAIDTLNQKGFDVTKAGELEEGDSTGAGLVAVADQFVRSRRGPDADAALLRDLVRNSPGSAVLIQYLEIMLAGKGAWNSWTGALSVGMSNSDLRGVLLDCESGEVLWRGELYIRDLPSPNNTRFAAATVGMFDNLENGGNDR